MTLHVCKHSNLLCSVIFVNFYNFFNNDVIMSSLVSAENCKLSHDCRQVSSHRWRDSTVSLRRRCVLGITGLALRPVFFDSLYLFQSHKHQQDICSPFQVRWPYNCVAVQLYRQQHWRSTWLTAEHMIYIQCMQLMIADVTHGVFVNRHHDNINHVTFWHEMFLGHECKALSV